MHICSECPNTITGRAKTCSDACRAKRSRKLRDASAKGTLPEKPEHLPEGVVQAAIQQTVQDALAPIVRETLTEDILQQIAALVKLTPKAVDAIASDLESDNEFIRQGAYRLIARYTLGHPSLVPDMESDKQVVVLVNGVARPGSEPQPSETLAHQRHPEENGAEEATETRLCDTCSTYKPVSEFVGTSHRCQSCFVRARDHAYSIAEKH